MKPPNENGPGSITSQGRNESKGYQAAHSSATVQRHPDNVTQMRELVGNLDHQQREVTTAYRDGFRDGWDVGYGHRLHEEELAWRVTRDTPGSGPSGTTPAERAALDAAYAAGIPCNTPHASGCSRCTRAAAVARHGGDYLGGPVEWEPRQQAREVA